MYNSSYLFFRISNLWEELGNWTNPDGGDRKFMGDVFKEEVTNEFLLAIGNISWQYKDCWIGANQSMEEAAAWADQFADLTEYLIHLIPNLLAQAVILNIYIDRITAY